MSVITTTELLTNAYNIAGIVALDYMPLAPSQSKTGLDCFNEVLGRVLIDPAIVPYWDVYSFNLVGGQETYNIENLIDVETFCFFLNDVRYPIARDDFRQYWGWPKAINVETPPVYYSQKRTLGGCEVSVTPSPSQTFPAEIRGAFGLSEATYGDDLSSTYDIYYITYLTALTAQLLCVRYTVEMPQSLITHLKLYDELVRKRSQPLDLTTSVFSVFHRLGYINYAYVNNPGGLIPTNRRFWR